MANMQDIEAMIWKSVVQDILYTPDAAIVKKWRALKKENKPIGVPVTPEVQMDDGHVAQAFSSGYVLVWVGGEKVEMH